MADYRQSCATPGCKWNGFNAHADFCPEPARLVQEESERRLKRKIAEEAAQSEFKEMLTDDLFRAAKDVRLRLEEANIEYRAAQEQYRAALQVIMRRGVYNEFRKFESNG